MVPNIDGTIGHTIKTRKHPRHGTLCVIQYPTNRNPAQSLQENAITVFGPRLYHNDIPKINSLPEITTSTTICADDVQLLFSGTPNNIEHAVKNICRDKPKNNERMVQ